MSVLIRPIISEKATADSEVRNRYSFVVSQKVNKIQIKQAVERTYGVTVEKVRTMNYAPVRKVRYTKAGLQVGKVGAYKKAVVYVAEGGTIDFYSNI